MKLTGITPILNVADVPASIAWFRQFGWKAGFTWNDHGMIEGAADRNASGPAQFAGICCGDVEMFLCRDGQGSRGTPPTNQISDNNDTGGVWMSWWLKTPAEVDEFHALAVSLGVAVAWPPTDEPWGVRECRIVHPDGHTFRISAPLVRV